MMYAALSIMNFTFDLVILILGLEQGRMSVSNGQTETNMGHGVEQINTTEVFKTTPFFDSKMGFRYNLQSFTMILAPIIDAFGAYLALKAVYEIQQSIPEGWDDFDQERAPFYQGPPPRRGGPVYYQGGGYQGGYGGGGGGGGQGNQGGGAAADTGGAGSTRSRLLQEGQQQGFQPFAGQGRSLGQDP